MQDFAVPKTRGFLAYIMQGRLNAVDFVVLAGAFLGWSMLRSARLPRWVFLVVFLLWRCCYNIGLGWILRTQSRSESFTGGVRRLLQSRRHAQLVETLIKPAIMAKMDKDYSFQVRTLDVPA